MAKHLKILGKGDPNVLGSVSAVREFIVSLISQIGMQPLGEPVVHDVELDIKKLGGEDFEDSGGITTQLVGYHTLTTSHCAVHTFVLTQEFYLDVFSCREFDQEKVVKFTKNYFNCYKMKISDVTKATEW
jgi:S-adenosylmethionine decarboxylase